MIGQIKKSNVEKRLLFLTDLINLKKFLSGFVFTQIIPYQYEIKINILINILSNNKQK